MSVIHAPGQVPVLEDDYLFNKTHETRWSYGNIASSTKIYYATRMGCSITILQWQLKRYNLRLASYASDAEGSLRMLCDLCAKFQLMHPKPNPYLRWQGCSQCITKTTFIDVSGQVINTPIKNSLIFILRVLTEHSVYSVPIWLSSWVSTSDIDVDYQHWRMFYTSLPPACIQTISPYQNPPKVFII